MIGRAYITIDRSQQYSFWKAKIFGAAYGHENSLAVLKMVKDIGYTKLNRTIGLIEFKK